MENVGRNFGWDMGVARLSEYDGNGFLGVQVDVYGEDASGMPEWGLEHAFGFASRPRDPEKSPTNPDIFVGCQVLHAWDGNEVHAWLASDPRYRPGALGGALIPQLSRGSSMVYDAAGDFSVLDVDKGWTLYVGLDRDAGGVPTAAHVLAAGVDDNLRKHVSLVHAGGMSIVMLEGGTIAISNATNTVSIVVDDSNIILNGNVKVQGALDIGLAGAVPLVKFPDLLAAWELLKVEIGAQLALKQPAVTPGPPVPLLTPLTGATLFTNGT